MSSSCLACTDPIAVCPTCASGESCVLVYRSCDKCSENVCRATSSSSSGGRSSIGGTVGGALGGVLGIVCAVALVYWFWWKPRGLAASRRRYSKHVTARQSKMLSTEKKGPASPPANANAANAANAAGTVKRSSVHLRMDGTDQHLTHRPTTPGGGDDTTAPSSAGATGGHTLNGSVDFEVDNPFGDHARSSVGTSDYSFRSSHSTNIIPIAYIPPHSNSVSLEDANRGAYGELLHDSPHPERILGGGGTRRSMMSLASRDSLALAGADQINVNRLPPVLLPDSPLVPLGASAGGAPIRPPRSPGLDLQLPKGSLATTTSPLLSPSSPSGSGNRPPSGFPWDPASSPNSNGASHFSMATTRASANSYLSAPDAKRSRGVSYLSNPGMTPSQQSHLSTMSASTSRSAGSTMSYILDPPQIITPVNAQGLRRVEVLGRGQAGLVRLPGSTAGATPTSPVPSPIASTSGTSPTTPRAVDQQRAAGSSTDANPFSDASRADGDDDDDEAEDLNDEERSARWTMSSVGSRMSVAQIMTVSPSAQAALAASAASSGGPVPTVPSSFYDVPHSARSSAVSVGDPSYDTGARARPLTSSSAWSSGTGDASASNDSRASLASSRSGATDSLSMLDGIPFMQSLPGDPMGDTNKAPSSPLFPMPPQRTPSINPPPSPTASFALSDMPESDHRNSQYSFQTAYSDNSTDSTPPPPPAPTSLLAQVISDDTRNASPLPQPFLPFAGQRPTSNASSAGVPQSRVQSQAMSVRSGFGSGLSQIPFQLGFPSGFDGSSERGSLISVESSRMGGSHESLGLGMTGSGYDRYEDEGMLSGVEEQTEPGSSEHSLSRRGSEQSVLLSRGPTPSTANPPGTVEEVDEAENPFGVHAEVGGGAGVRASTDTLALSAELARNLEALDY